MRKKPLSQNPESANQLAAVRMGGEPQDFLARASSFLALEPPRDADATKPRLVDFMSFLDQ